MIRLGTEHVRTFKLHASKGIFYAVFTIIMLYLILHHSFHDTLMVDTLFQMYFKLSNLRKAEKNEAAYMIKMIVYIFYGEFVFSAYLATR